MTNVLGVRGAGGPAGPARSTGKDVSQREDLADFITMITRDETPFISSIGKAKATAIYHEWQTDELETPGDSRIGEGTDYIERLFWLPEPSCLLGLGLSDYKAVAQASLKKYRNVKSACVLSQSALSGQPICNDQMNKICRSQAPFLG